LIEDKAALQEAITSGKWPEVLELIKNCELPEKVLWPIYEEIIYDLVLKGEEDTAKELLREAPDILELKTSDGARFDELQDVVYHDYSSGRKQLLVQQEQDGKIRKERWVKIAKQTAAYIHEGQPSRLLELLGNALTWRAQQGLDTTVLGGKQRRYKATNLDSSTAQNANKTLTRRKRHRDDSIMSHGAASSSGLCEEEYAKIKLGGAEASANVAVFADDELSFVTGSRDGLIDVWNVSTGKLRRDLSYQEDGGSMMHKGAILGLSFSADGKILASASMDGTIKFWDIETGKRISRVKRAHQGHPVNCVELSRSGEKALSGGDDHCARLFGVLSGNMLTEFSGHESQVTSAIFLDKAETVVITASSDKSVRTWDILSGTSTRVFKFESSICGVQLGKLGGCRLCVVAEMNGALTCFERDLLLKPSRIDDRQRQIVYIGEEIQGIVTNSRADALYALSENGTVHAVVARTPDSASNTEKSLATYVPQRLQVVDEAKGIALHPREKLMGIFTSKGSVRLFRPKQA